MKPKHMTSLETKAKNMTSLAMTDKIASLPPRESEYAKAIRKTPRTTADLIHYFGTTEKAVYRMLIKLIRKGVVARKKRNVKKWRTAEGNTRLDDALPVTPRQYAYLLYMRRPKSTKELMKEFGVKASSARITRSSLEQLGYVEHIFHMRDTYRKTHRWQITKSGEDYVRRRKEYEKTRNAL